MDNPNNPVRQQLKSLKEHEYYTEPKANIEINAPLALAQIEHTGKVQAGITRKAYDRLFPDG